MKKTSLALVGLALTSSFSAKALEGDYDGYDDFSSFSAVQDITSRILRVATQYANAISCGGVEIEPSSILALHPLKSRDDFHSAKFAVVWGGSIGCSGGSGSYGTHVAIVSAGYGFYVIPEESSPMIRFESPRFINKLVGNTEDTIILDAKAHAEGDSSNFPSLRVKITLKKDQNYNWSISNKEVMEK